MSTNFLYSQAVTPGMVYSTHLARSAQSPPTSRKPSTVSSGGVAATEDPWRRQAELKDLSLDKKDNLRYIYRLMDTNGDKRVSPRELRAGLKEMGYDFFAHPVALDELVREIDEDLTGYISEGEFLNFFRREHSAILGKYKNIPQSSLQSVMVFRYPSGRSDLFQGTKGVEVCLIPAASLASFLADAMKEKPRLQYNYWVEVCGYDQQVFTATAEVFGFQHDDFSELLVFSQPNSKNVSGTIRAGRSYVFHEADLSRDPIPKRGVNIVGAIFCGGDHATPYYLSPEYLRGRRLDTSGKIHEIRVAQEQVGLFVPHERVLLSFVHPLEQLTADKRRKKLTSGFVSFSDYLAGAKVPKLKDIHDTRLLQARSVDDLFDRIRDRIDREFRQATRELSIARCTRMIVEKLVATNYSTRDKLRDWMELIDASVRGRCPLAPDCVSRRTMRWSGVGGQCCCCCCSIPPPPPPFLSPRLATPGPTPPLAPPHPPPHTCVRRRRHADVSDGHAPRGDAGSFGRL